MDLWTYLQSTDKPKIIYGMGNGADKILSVFSHYGISCDGIFASDAFVRPGKKFHDMPIESYADISARYDDFIVLVSFATSLPDVTENILRIGLERELYAPCVPVYGDTLFTEEYYIGHRTELEYAKELLYDEESKRIFENVIDYRLSGKIEYLLKAESDPDEVWKSILKPFSYRNIADCGAYTGDTAIEFTEKCPNVEKIWALEPDTRNFRRLSQLTDPRVIPINKGAWDGKQQLEFNIGAGRGAAVGRKGKTAVLDFDSLDSILAGEGVDHIKYDVEGAEERALAGSENTIRKYSPDLLVSLYHRTEDIFKLIGRVHELCPEHRLYLRRFKYIPDWDLNLYAVKD